MKKALRGLLAMLCVLSLSAALPLSTLAAGTVTYDGNSKKFIFAPGSEYSPTDLFSDFKNIMPGQSITQRVHIKNDSRENVKIKLYMRSLGAKDGSEELLSRLLLSVSRVGASKLFEAPAADTAGLTDWAYLGTFYSGAEIDLDVTLTVPKELGNEFGGAVGYLNWQFRVEELPTEPDDPRPPKTGDEAAVVLYCLSALVSGIALTAAILIFTRGRRKGE